MMKKQILAALLFFSGTYSLYAQNTSGKYSIEVFGNNKSAYRLHYTISGSGFDKAELVKAALYSYENYKWSVQDIVLKTTDSSRYDGQFSVPENAALNYVRFYQGDFQYPDKIDNNSGKGFEVPVSVVKNGYYIGRLQLRKSALHQIGEQGYSADNDAAYSKEETLHLFEKELAMPHTDTTAFITAYFSYLRLKDSTVSLPLIKNTLARWLTEQKLSSQQQSAAYNYVRFGLRDSAWADNLSVQILQNDPHGSLARWNAFMNLNKNSQTPEQHITAMNNFLKAFPFEQWKQNPDEQYYIYYEVFRNLSAAYFDQKQIGNFLKLTADLDFKTLNEIYRWNIMRAYVFKLAGIDTVAKVSVKMMDNMLSKTEDGSLMTNGFFPVAYANANAHIQLDDRIETQIEILNSVHQYDLAAKYYRFLSDKGRFKNPNLNEAYLETLTHTASEKDIRSFLEKCVYADAVTPKMTDKLKALYEEKNDKKISFDDYFNSLKSPVTVAEIHKYVKNGMLNTDVEPFAMEDSKGALVRSSDWEGKIVVLDFWATWCKPCIASFPSMQRIVDKYAADKNVAFYFVGTMQYDDYKEKDSMYLKNNGFRFNLLYDGINPETKSQSAVFSKFAKIFNSSGIPRKVIMKDGMIRYSTEGFGGSSSNLTEELSYAIDLLKQEDEK